MNPPDRKVDALSAEHLMPGEDVLIDAVDERSVEVEKESRGCLDCLSVSKAR
jgi:hypothetical protein